MILPYCILLTCKAHFNGRADTEDSISKLEPLVLKEDGSRDESVSMKNNTHPVRIIASVHWKPMKLKEEASSHPFKTFSA